MLPRRKAQAAFASAVLLLVLSGIAGYFSVNRFVVSERWVLHSYEVRDALGEIDWAILRAGRARAAYLGEENPDFLNQFQVATAELPGRLRRLKDLTSDNAKQQLFCDQLEKVLAQRIDIFQQSIQLKAQSPRDQKGQLDLTRQGVAVATEMTSITSQMRAEEQRLLEIRLAKSHRFLIITALTLAIAFIGALELFAVHYRFLAAELEAREEAERSARDSEEALRRLTARLLQLQDAERRKFSRELHDSLGQYLAGAKMNLELFRNQSRDLYLKEASDLLDQAIAETRTISHLLHPPLLDEAGFSSAAQWYLEGFAQRSGIAIDIDLGEDVGALPQPLALGLFRVLQESLTNIHRHSNSSKADVALKVLPGEVVLKVRDYGKGIAPDTLELFRSKGTNSGVGLAGMRERVRELGGQLAIQSCQPGTMISASMPLANEIKPLQLTK